MSNAKPAGPDKYIWGDWPLGDNWYQGGNRCKLLWVTLDQVEEILDHFTLDQLQLFLQGETFSAHLRRDLEPYFKKRILQYRDNEKM